MKKEVLRYLKEEAAKLPVKLTLEPHTERFTGAEVIESAKRLGKPVPPGIKPNKTYPVTTRESFEVNHLGKMKALYKSGGMPAVDKYIKSFEKK